VTQRARQEVRRPAVAGRRFAIAAARAASVDAALAMIEAGGNAMDAAVAAAFVAGTVEPMETTLAGSGFLMVHAQGRTRCVEFGPRAPLAARPDMFRIDPARMRDGGLGVSVVEGDANTQGILAAGVPATIPGLCMALATYGRLPLATVLAPAIAAAHGGFAAEGYFALEALGNLAALRADSMAASLFLVNGDPPAVPHLGAATLGVPPLIRQAALGRTLEILAAKGVEAWRGEIGAALVATHRDQGGLLTLEDLAREPVIAEPLMRDLGDGFRAALPAAPCGGVTVLQMLGILRAMGGGHDPRHLLHAAWHAFADRYHWLGDPDQVPVPLDALLGEASFAAAARTPPPFAAHLILRGPAGHHGDPRCLDGDLRRLDRAPRGVKIAKLRLCRLGLLQPCTRGHRLILEPADRKPCRLQLAASDRPVRFGPRQRPVRFGQPRIRRPTGIPGFLIGYRQFCQFRLQGLMRALCTLRPGGDLFQIALQLHQPVKLLQAQRRGGRRILGPRPKPVPTPEVALDTHQPLPGSQGRLQPESCLARHKPDLAQPARQHRGRPDPRGKRLGTRRQILSRFISWQNCPARTGIAHHFRRTQIIRQRRTQSLLEPRLHLQPVQKLMPRLRLPLDQPRQRRDLCPKC
jgi:hypothetical protein